MCLMLVVDDEELVRESVSAILSSLGHEILQANDGLEALRIYRSMQGEISLIIMDVVMPRMDGIAASKIIKTVNPSAKVILMSGYSEQFVADGSPDAFLPKPFRSKDLTVTIERVLKMA